MEKADHNRRAVREGIDRSLQVQTVVEGERRKVFVLIPGAGREETGPDPVAGRKEAEVAPGVERERSYRDLTSILTTCTSTNQSTNTRQLVEAYTSHSLRFSSDCNEYVLTCLSIHFRYVY